MIDLRKLEDAIIAKFEAMSVEQFAENLRQKGHEVEVTPVAEFQREWSGTLEAIESEEVQICVECLTSAANSNELALAA